MINFCLKEVRCSTKITLSHNEIIGEGWLDGLNDDERNEVEIFSCGPHPMLEAVAKLAAEYDLPCQVSLEEFMACAVGSYAGCVVKVETENGPAMQRVCVDGSVFDAKKVFGH